MARGKYGYGFWSYLVKMSRQNAEILFAIIGHSQGFHSGPYLSAVFGPCGLVEASVCAQVFFMAKKIQPQISGPGKVGLFSSLEDIEEFCRLLASKMDSEQVYLMDVRQYADALSCSEHLNDLQRELARRGKAVYHRPQSSRSGFLDKIFS